jgi:hypothetical protein
MEKFTKIFHVSPSGNIDSILKNGLTPLIGPRAEELGESEPAIYLFPDLASVDTALWNWMGDCFDEDEVLALFEVTVPTELAVVEPGQFEVVIRETIPAKFITLLAADIDAVLTGGGSIQTIVR